MSIWDKNNCIASAPDFDYDVKSLFVCPKGGDDGKDVPLKEGAVTDIKIEVTSEDGTIQHYFVHVKRLSAKDAFLSDLQLSVGSLTPEFNPDVLSYSCMSISYVLKCPWNYLFGALE